MGYQGSKYYGTLCEIDFIKKLGTGIFRGRSMSMSRLEMLKGYLSGALKRVNWGAIDREEVIRQTENQIFIEEY